MAVRTGAGVPRTQSSVAVSADHRRWFLSNASPEVRTQFEAFPALHPRDRDRTSPLQAVLLTDAEHLPLLAGLDLGGARVVDTDGEEWAALTAAALACFGVANDVWLQSDGTESLRRLADDAMHAVRPGSF